MTNNTKSTEFSWCKTIESIVIPDGTKKISKYAFIKCINLKKCSNARFCRRNR